MKTFAELVKGYRKRKGLSQSQAAIHLGVPKRTLQNWEIGHREPVGFALRILELKLGKKKKVRLAG